MSSPIVIAALYRFVRLDNFESLRKPLLQFMLDNQVRGTLLLAAEGINGTVAGSEASITRLLDYLREDERLRDIDYKLSYDDEIPFYRSRVKLKREIVTMGVEDIDPAHGGTYVDRATGTRLSATPRSRWSIPAMTTSRTSVVSTGRYCPRRPAFREFPAYVKNHLDSDKHRKVAMFCTGGIRCEKSTAYLRQQGFDEVYHLRGGILKYLEEVPEAESMWHGECFVFDNRVSVNHALEKGSYDQCHACRRPITEQDKLSDKYQPGISCPACHDSHSDEDRARYREREKQVRLARERGELHIGADAARQARKRKTLKLASKQAQREHGA